MYVPSQQGLRLQVFLLIVINKVILRVYVPSQQGLRLCSFASRFACCISQSVCSITTRIKTLLMRCDWQQFVCLRVHVPSQQGLRLFFSNCSLENAKLRVHVPSQQGLRLVWDQIRNESAQSVCSITTRIKTIRRSCNASPRS